MPNNKSPFKSTIALCATALLVSTVVAVPAVAHQDHAATSSFGPDGAMSIDWPEPQISKLVSAGYGESLGSDIYPRQGFPEVHHIDKSVCATGSYLAFDVNDDYAFDIDERLTLSFRVKANGANRYYFAYDRNAKAETYQAVAIKNPKKEWQAINLPLERARFANRGQAGVDFLLVSAGADTEDLQLDKTHKITVCDIKLARSIKEDKNKDPSKPTGRLKLITEVAGEQVPVRVGLYDETGRMPLPSDRALSFQHYGRAVTQHFLRETWGSHETWPSDNRYFFYSDGDYQAEIPAGKYSLVISKGPEYRVVNKTIEVKKDEIIDLSVSLNRFVDLPKQGWYSGDGHIHLSRLSAGDNKKVLTILEAEDIHVSNLLRMGNFATTHFSQYAFGEAGQYQSGDHALASGVEDPRTAHRGHTIGLNVTEPVHDRDNYYLYHQVFAAHQQQGGLTGYAHVDAGWFNEDRGLALDVPFGLVDFVEIMQDGQIFTKQWYDFLNLGYKLQPMAGSDYPYIDQPGSVRTYAKIKNTFSPHAWFDAVKSGHVYVSNGAFLTLTANGKSIGEAVHLKRGEGLTISAEVLLNPDYDLLDRLELVVQGDVIKTVSANSDETKVVLSHTMNPEQGLWLAIRAYGKNNALAHSAPIYVQVGSSNHAAQAKVAEITERLIQQLQQMKQTPDPVGELEYWQIKPGFEGLWKKQKTELFQRVDQAIEQYQSLLL